MREGSFFFVVAFPTPWPPPEVVSFVAPTQGGHTFTSSMHPDGHLEFRVEGPSGVKEHTTQPVTFKLGGPKGRNLVTFVWSDKHSEVHIDGKILKTLDEEKTAVELDCKDIAPQGPLSYLHPDAKARCQKWIAWRRLHFGNPKSPKDISRRPKTNTEQVQELMSAIEALSLCVESVRAGKLFILPIVAGQLRSLVYWQFTKSGHLNESYNPLLIRIAARLDLPLPVFAFADDTSTRPQFLNDAMLHLRQNPVSLQTALPGHKLMDMQEWLEVPASAERLKTVLPIVEAVLPTVGIIGLAANTLGFGHFDETVPKSINTLAQVKWGETTFLAEVFVNAGNIVTDLGRYVIGKCQDLNLGQDGT